MQAIIWFGTEMVCEPQTPLTVTPFFQELIFLRAKLYRSRTSLFSLEGEDYLHLNQYLRNELLEQDIYSWREPGELH